MKEKLKPIISLIRLQNDNRASLDAIDLTSSHIHLTPHSVLILTSFRLDQFSSNYLNSFRSDSPLSGFSHLYWSDLPPLNNKKTDKEPIGEFLGQSVYCCMGIKDFLPKRINLYKYTSEVVAFMVMTGKECLSPNIWTKTSN